MFGITSSTTNLHRCLCYFPLLQTQLYSTRPSSPIHRRSIFASRKSIFPPLCRISIPSEMLFTSSHLLPLFPSAPPDNPLPLYRPRPPPRRPGYHLHAPHHAHHAPNPDSSPPAPKGLFLRPLHARLQVAHLGPKSHRHSR